jgi:polyhydroxybutyrate depolymerase
MGLRTACLALLLLSAATPVLAETLTVNGERRDFILDGAGPEPRPLIIALHGGGGSAKRFRRANGLQKAALTNGFAIVWPDSDGGNWNDGRITPSGELVSSAQDEAFILSLVQQLVDNGVADPNHVYMTGHSNGGMMSFALGCKHPKIFKAIAPVSANIPEPMNCKGQQAIAVLNIVGLRDRVVPFEGGGIFGRPKRGGLKSVEEGFAILAARNGCKKISQKTNDSGQLLLGESCAKPTRQIRIEGQGHRWPDLATGAIIDLFKRH